MKNPEEVQLNFHPRPTETVSIKIPTDTLQSLQKIAAVKDMSVEALLKFYIGQCLRQDLAKQFSGRLMEKNF
ncbi:hypothetical protein NIES4071_71020 [Calothrix sp. NIES-4071]|nr:hypothetical protein NIES4071_71020 [Calothrix sp. NIES-4071]BAZ61377.1 hypothetical protein NIES4105_70970 [Calothrix sp. NIES-4105]